MSNLTSWPLLGLLGIGLCGCAGGGEGTSGGSSGDGVVRGTVTYRERIALAPDAVIRITLSDVSLADAPAVVLAEATITAGGRQVPVPFELAYDRAAIRAQHTYTVRAAIYSGDSMAWTTDTLYPVITREYSNRADLVLKRVEAPPVGAGRTTSPASGSLVGTSWHLVDLHGRGALENAAVTLEFPEEGRVAGKGSCNRYFGPVVIKGQSITFGAVGSTMMMCPEEVMNQERDFFRALETAERYEINGDLLYVYCKGADAPLKFRRN